ncbi:hypothetical protein [Streptomyces sodiiphilus]
MQERPEQATSVLGTGAVPPPAPLTVGRVLGGALTGLVLISGLVGALLLAGPALDVNQQEVPAAPEAAEEHQGR